MESFKNHQKTLQEPLSKSNSKPHYLCTIIFTLLLVVFFFFSASDQNNSPAISYNTLAAKMLHSNKQPNEPSPPLSSSSTSLFAGAHYESCTLSEILSPGPDENKCITHHQVSRNAVLADEEKFIGSCDVFDGQWVADENFGPAYEPGSCPFVDDSFNCFKNGRPDSDYLRLKWKPHACEIPRFDGLKMLKLLKGKRIVFVGDSLNRNMWESLVCGLRESLTDKRRVIEVSGRGQFKSLGFYSFKFKDFNCSIDFIKSPFLVQEWNFSDKAGTRRETLRLDIMESSYNKYYDADMIVFNTGHWWTHQKTFKGKNYFQEGSFVYSKLEVADAYRRALKTWSQWVDDNIDSSRTRVFFTGYSASHFKGGQWNSGGSCDGETRPITNDAHLGPYPWMMRVLETEISRMKTPVFYLNITKMTDYRKDGHPSIFRQPAPTRKNGSFFQDCSHWCLPGVPDSWNELLYAVLVKSDKKNLVSTQ
ncbi:Protein trichome birefringence-like 4 [Castilleja foliolosa]|uniref:Protein trichome birefringence-like 4 n=1 Tax=Castilleja foliolosa TaxID=1961234 RepID=A0ABD3C9Q7_9LAMI